MTNVEPWRMTLRCCWASSSSSSSSSSTCSCVRYSRCMTYWRILTYTDVCWRMLTERHWEGWCDGEEYRVSREVVEWTQKEVLWDRPWDTSRIQEQWSIKRYTVMNRTVSTRVLTVSTYHRICFSSSSVTIGGPVGLLIGAKVSGFSFTGTIHTTSRTD